MASPPDKSQMNGLRRASRLHTRHSLRHFLGLEPNPSPCSYVEDVVFVAINFKNGNDVMQGTGYRQNSQLGLAVLDTNNLLHHTPENIVSVSNYAAGDLAYHEAVNEEFGFGETAQIEREDMLVQIEKVIPRKRERNIVLVGYQTMNALLVLWHLGFNFDSIIGVIDICALAKEQRAGPIFALESILQRYNCSYGDLHNAGNNVYFVLRALLALACKSYSKTQNDDENTRERLQDWKARVLHYACTVELIERGISRA